MDPARVVINPEVMVGKPIIAGTRITVELILEKLAAGQSAERIQEDHAHLPPGSVRAALEHAVAAVRGSTAPAPARQSA